VTWVSEQDSDVRTQIVIYKNGNAGDFYLNVRYGLSNSASYDIASLGSSLPGVAGFSLGATTLSFNSPVPEAAGHFYSFAGGELAGAQPVDGDGDGVPNTTDNCPSNPNPDQLNTDGDGFGDICDSDDDSDSVLDTADNCPLIANTSQLNTDGDARGNACDTDDDNDSVLDTTDNCPLVANTAQTDSDGDHVGDACDSTPNPVVKRCRVDSDNDVDAHDILAIIASLSRRASGPKDPRDADGNGTIQLKDALLCTAQCTRWFCAVR
jgi:hypothetical protein